MPRVLHIITSLEVGGAEKMLCKVVEELSSAGFACVVISLKAPGPLARILKERGVQVYSLGLGSLVDVPRALIRLAKLLRELKPDLVQTWLYHADLLGTVAIWLARVRCRLLWNIRCSGIDFSLYSKSTRIAVSILARISRYPDGILVNSQAGLTEHISYGYRPKRWRLIPNGFDLKEFKPDAVARARIRGDLGIPGDGFVVGMVARFDPMKDHRTLLDAATIVVARCGRTSFVLCGRGVDHSNEVLVTHSAYQTGRVRLLGERSDVSAILASLDVLVLPSLFGEGFPNVLGEAMACGVPCIVTQVGDCSAIIGNSGLLIPFQSPEALAQAIEALRDESDDEASRRRVDARRRVLENFDVHVIGKQYAAEYTGVLNS
ncbi:glycosyltransferase [Rhodopseudomonas palustris]|uniref:glycosyltransferase family 4 protein n=1 Tax=Rhodopseudomonas palustris TaxID=1076 RepID=UPI0022F10493|nr:glycosyltransferase [Rhodopseudomonas palustris]WBU31263.1 glycosyltransferase [Rhodopseudomonas palustris]